MKTLSMLLQGITTISHQQDCEVKGLALDSRLVKPGDLFFACVGTQLDGRQFITDAMDRGAVAILAEETSDTMETTIPIIYIHLLRQQMSRIAARFYGQPAERLNLIGITGTNGKTSCTYFIADILQQLQLSCGVMGTLGNGLYGHIQPGQLTTPDPITLQRYLATFEEQGAKYVAMEVSSHSLDQGRVKGIPFKIGVFTNLTRDHLDYHGSMESYAETKKKLFTDNNPSFCVINADDEIGREWVSILSPTHNVYAYTTDSTLTFSPEVNVINVDEVQLNESGIYANVYTPWGKGEFHVPLLGRFNLSNILAVITTLCLLDIPLQAVLNALSRLTPVPGRMQTIGGKNQPLVVVDYSHTPDSLEKALQALRLHCDKKLYCVFGCGGDRDRGKRPLMAKVAERLADHIIVTDDNPRTEDPEQIVRDIMEGFDNSGRIIVRHDRAQAIRDVIHRAEAGDCILIAGKGAETYQQIGQHKYPFNDAEEVTKNL